MRTGMSQQFSKLQANAPPKPPDVATGLMPARVQRPELGSQTPHSPRGEDNNGTRTLLRVGWEGLHCRRILSVVCGFPVVGRKEQAYKQKHSVLSLQHDFFEATILLCLFLCCCGGFFCLKQNLSEHHP